MTAMTLEALKEQIALLSKEDRTRLFHWLDEMDQDEWAEEIDRDFAPGGTGTAVFEEMKAETLAGKFQPFDRVGEPEPGPKGGA